MEWVLPVWLGDLSCLGVVLEVCDEVLEHLAPRPLLHPRKVGRSVRRPLRVHHLFKEKRGRNGNNILNIWIKDYVQNWL